MKSNSHRLFPFNSPGLNVVIKALQSDKAIQDHSPYLKAILSGQASAPVSTKNIVTANPDRDAALRYIRESRMLRK